MDDIKDPNRRESSKGKVVPDPHDVKVCVSTPITTALNTVPKTAKARIGKRSRRKARLSMLRDDWNMIGGNKMCKNKSLSNVSFSLITANKEWDQTKIVMSGFSSRERILFKNVTHNVD
jgi:hypothetical protein